MIDLRLGDCLEVMRTLADNTVDSVVTDPPYGIRFMGMAWDGQDIERRAADRRAAASSDPQATDMGGHKSTAAEAGKYDLSPAAMLAFQAFSEDWAREAFRVLKPGGYLLTFASTRTYHRMTCGVEAAGFEIRDQIGWVFGSGFPKSHNGPWGGTALKPAWEPICVARKPLAGTVEQNWREHGTGALNIDGCRIQTTEDRAPITGRGGIPARHNEHESRGAGVVAQPHSLGRWPANLIHDGSDEVVALFPQSSGQSGAVTGDEPTGNGFSGVVYGRGGVSKRQPAAPRNDSGSAARFFYCAKASKEDRDDGLHGFALRGLGIAMRGHDPDPYYVRVHSPNPDAIAAYLREWRERSGLTKGEADAAIGGSTLYSWFEGRPAGIQLPTPEMWLKLKQAFGFDDRHDKEMTEVRLQEKRGFENSAPLSNHHPTVKPTDLMRYLCRLVTPAGGLILDPFMGSGSTGRGAVLEGFRFIGIEREAEYIEIAQARIDSARRQGHQPDLLEQAA